MSILERYIAASMIRATLVTLLVLVVLLVFFNFVDELDEVGRGDYQLLDAFVVAALTVPRYLFEVFPVAALLGALTGLGAMAAHSELLAMRTAGFTLRRIVAAVIKAGLLMLLLAFAFGELVAPPSERFAQQLKSEKIAGQVMLKSLYGFWARDGRAFINIRTIASGVHLKDIYIYEFDEQSRLRLATYAREANYQGDHWTLHGISQSQIDAEEVQTRTVEQARWDSLLDPGLLSVVVIRPTMLPIWGLSQYIDFMLANGQSAVEYQVAFWLKLANPVAALVMLLLAVPFVLGHQRSTSMGQRIFLGTVVGTGFFMLTRAMSYTAVVYHLNPAISAVLPTLVVILAAILMLRRVR